MTLRAMMMTIKMLKERFLPLMMVLAIILMKDLKDNTMKSRKRFNSLLMKYNKSTPYTKVSLILKRFRSRQRERQNFSLNSRCRKCSSKRRLRVSRFMTSKNLHCYLIIKFKHTQPFLVQKNSLLKSIQKKS